MVNAGDGGAGAAGSVWSAAVVEADEGCQGAVALGAVGPDAAVRPFDVEGSEEALDLAIPARGARRDQDVTGAEPTQRGGEEMALGVALRVVAHHRLDGPAALLGEPLCGAGQRG